MRRAVLRCALLFGALTLCVAGAAGAHTLGGMIRDVPTGSHVRHAGRAHAAALDYGGGPVLHSNRSHVMFWQPSGSGLNYDTAYQALIEQFLVRVAGDSHRATNVYGLTGQYTDSHGPAAYASSYGGSVTDTDPLPTSQCIEPPVTGPGWLTCLTDAQLQQELEHVVAVNHLPHGPTDVYFIVLPNGFGTCTDSSSDSCALGGSGSGYCGYHGETQNAILYAVIPYNAVSGHCQSDNPRPNASTADPALSTVSHEHSEMITDPQAYNAWIDANGNEDGDLCITAFGPALGGAGDREWNEVIGGGHYYLQAEWSNEDGGCQPRDETDSVFFAAPERAQAGKRLEVTPRASDPDGAIIAYRWYFGDGAASHHRNAAHTFARPGSYRVVLRAVDSAANWSSFARTVRVAPAPAAAAEPRRPVKRR